MSFFRKKRLFIILLGFILLVALIGFSMRDREDTTLAEAFVSDTVGWIQNIFHKPAEFTASIFSNIEDIKNTYEENELLKSRLSQYKSLLYEVQELKAENKELRSVLDKGKSMMEYDPIQSTVIARSPEAWFQQMTIDRGQQHGVKANMAVITSEGMIGKVQTANKFTSKIKLLSGFDQNNRVSAVIAREEGDDILGLIEGYDMEKESLILNEILTDQEIKEGEMVVSSGKGGVFPEGLVIGKINEVTPDQHGLTKMAYVTPAADLTNIDHVMVVERLAEMPEKEIGSGEEGEE